MEFVAIVQGTDGVQYGGEENGTLRRLDKLEANGIPWKILKPGREWVKTLKWIAFCVLVSFLFGIGSLVVYSLVR